MGTFNNGITALAQAQAQEEGFNVYGSLPNTLNNPGDLTSGGTLQSFATPQSGWNALIAKLSNIASGKSSVYPANETIAQFEQTYTGGDPNAASNVASILGNGVTPNTLISSILNSTPLGAVVGASSSAVSGAADFASTIDEYTIRAVVVVVGIVFIAGAIFSFSKVRDTVVETVKAGAVAAG